MQTQEKSSFLRTIFKRCPYTHLWQAIKTAYKEKKLPASAKNGAMIALLGLFCPLFWMAYFRGASGSELLFHAAHSGAFVVIGVIMMLAGLAKK